VSASPRIHVIDSHTGGEPTRVVVSGGPDLGAGDLSTRTERFRKDFDRLRSAIVNEPRGSDVVVGALLAEPADVSCAAGVIFFNNVGYLGMCGHGTMGLAVTLAHLGRIQPGEHRIETPVGVVSANLIGANDVAVENVQSYRYRADVSVQVEGLGELRGDIAWGGNWFYLVNGAPAPLNVTHAGTLSAAAEKVMAALREQGITGEAGAEIDHIEFFGPPESAEAQSRNFVCCPGGAYDRSPCGTGTSAKLACLAAAGKLQPGKVWVQESVIGSRFSASYRVGSPGRIIPTIQGQAFVCAEGDLIRQPQDPYIDGIV